MNFWDTADVYGNGANEELLSKVLCEKRNQIFIATKFGFRLRNEKGSVFGGGESYVDGSPAYVRQAVEKSLRRLKIETIDLYYAHRIDPSVPVEETVGAMAELVKEGKVRYLGLSECSPETLRKANAVHPIAAVESEYSLLTRDVEKEIVPLTKELEITLVPFSPLGRGLVTNTIRVEALGTDDYRKHLPATTANIGKTIKGYLPDLRKSQRGRGLLLHSLPWPGCWHKVKISFLYREPNAPGIWKRMQKLLMWICLPKILRT